VSVGRGTDTPFEVVGRAVDQGRELAAFLNGRAIQSVRFVPIVFTPSSSNFMGERCEGCEPDGSGSQYSRHAGTGDRTGSGAAQTVSQRLQNWSAWRICLVNQSAFDALTAAKIHRRIARGLARPPE